MDDSFLRLFRKRQTVLLVILSFLSVVMLLLSTRSLTGLPERVGLGIASFFQRIGSGVGNFVGGTVNSISELRTLRADYEEAMSQLSRYENLERGYAELRRENASLRDQLGFVSQPGLRRLAAEIIAKDPGNLYSTMIINQGSSHGVKRDMPVIAYQGGIQGLVGRVIEVSRDSSMVLPIYDPDSFVACRLDESRYEGLVAGLGQTDKALVMRYVNRAAAGTVQGGDLVTTSGLNAIYPKGIVVGRVSRLLEKDHRPSIEFELDPVIDFSRLEFVFVLIEPVRDAEAGDIQ